MFQCCLTAAYYHGTDAFKALALGAKAVGLGHASLWALGAYGAPGVTEAVFQIMQKELVAAMAKAGRPTVASLDPSAVKAHLNEFVWGGCIFYEQNYIHQTQGA